MSGHADTIHAALTRLAVYYPGPEDANKAHAALDALVAENQQQAETIGELQAVVDDLFERNGWLKIGWERPPEHVFEYFRALHGIEAGTSSEDELLPCHCHGDDLVPYCPRHSPLPVTPSEDTE